MPPDRSRITVVSRRSPGGRLRPILQRRCRSNRAGRSAMMPPRRLIPISPGRSGPIPPPPMSALRRRGGALSRGSSHPPRVPSGGAIPRRRCPWTPDCPTSPGRWPGPLTRPVAAARETCSPHAKRRGCRGSRSPPWPSTLRRASPIPETSPGVRRGPSRSGFRSRRLRLRSRWFRSWPMRWFVSLDPPAPTPLVLPKPRRTGNPPPARLRPFPGSFMGRIPCPIPEHRGRCRSDLVGCLGFPWILPRRPVVLVRWHRKPAFDSSRTEPADSPCSRDPPKPGSDRPKRGSVPRVRRGRRGRDSRNPRRVRSPCNRHSESLRCRRRSIPPDRRSPRVLRSCVFRPDPGCRRPVRHRPFRPTGRLFPRITGSRDPSSWHPCPSGIRIPTPIPDPA